MEMLISQVGNADGSITVVVRDEEELVLGHRAEAPPFERDADCQRVDIGAVHRGQHHAALSGHVLDP